jgi:hypothetical protein
MAHVKALHCKHAGPNSEPASLGNFPVSLLIIQLLNQNCKELCVRE